MKRKIKIVGIVLLCLFALVVVSLAIVKVSLDASYFKGYDPSAPLESSVTDVQEKPAYTHMKVYFNGSRGDRVPTLLLAPKSAARPMPCVIFLHGIGQEKDFVEEQFDGRTVADPFLNAGFAFAAFDQFTRGERRKKRESPWQGLKDFRMRAAYTVNDTRRLIDYLDTRDDIAHDRIYLVGASYGAITGSTAAAFDKRIRAVVLTYGGGNMRAMLSSRATTEELRKKHIPVALVQLFGWYFLSASDPLHYIDEIAPRPILLQNGTDDSLIASAAAKALQDAAPEPKTIKIYDGDHIGTDVKTVFVVLNDGLDFIKQQDAKIVSEESRTKPVS
jgi:dienelactone hydrolase